MEQNFFNAEAFSRTLDTLRTLGEAHESKNDQALKRHNTAYFENGPDVSSQMPDVADVDNYKEVGKAIVGFISTIPGVSTQGMLEKVSNPDSIALSNLALSARLRREGNAEVGVSLSFTQWRGGHELSFDRTEINKQLFEISLNIGSDGIPIDGKIQIGQKDGQFVIIRDTLEFSLEGNVINDYPKYNLQAGENLDIIKIIQKVTTVDNLKDPIDAVKIINDSTRPRIEAQKGVK
jgi:hypothetical protein